MASSLVENYGLLATGEPAKHRGRSAIEIIEVHR
jgi:hypothetical protein